MLNQIRFGIILKASEDAIALRQDHIRESFGLRAGSNAGLRILEYNDLPSSQSAVGRLMEDVCFSMGRNYLSTITRERLAFALIIVSAASLGLHNLGSQPFWLDEAFSATFANSHAMSFVKLALGREASMAFYYVMLHGWLMLVSPSDFNIRLLSTIFAVGAVAALYVLARKLFGPSVGLAAAALLAVNPLFLSYAQEARSYTLTVFLTLVSWSFFIESCWEPKFLNLTTYVGATTLAIYSHTLAMLILPVQGVALFFVQREPGARVRVASALCTICLLVVPLFPIAAHFYDKSDAWIAARVGPPGLHSLGTVALSFAGAVDPPFIRRRALEALFGAGFFMFIERFVRAVRRSSAEVGSCVFVVSAFGLPIAVLMGVSQIFPLFIVRYVLICLPFFLLMIAAGWVSYSQRWVAATGLMLLVLLSLWSDQSYYSSPRKPDWPTLIQYITDNAHHDDKLAFAPACAQIEFERNFRRFAGGATQPTIIYPHWDSTFEVKGQYMGSPALMAKALTIPYERLWIVQLHLTGDGSEPLLNHLIAKYPVVLRKEFRYMQGSTVSVIFCGGHR